MKKGETRSGPRSRRTSCCSAIPGSPPIAEPTTIPTLSGSAPFTEASRHASCAAPSASRTLRSIRRASLGGATDDGSKPFTSPAIRTGKPLVSKPWMKSTPLSPATAACQVEGASRPIGVIAPSPVTATLRTGQS